MINAWIIRIFAKGITLYKISINSTYNMVSVTNTAKKKIFTLLDEEGLGADAYVTVGVSSNFI